MLGESAIVSKDGSRDDTSVAITSKDGTHESSDSKKLVSKSGRQLRNLDDFKFIPLPPAVDDPTRVQLSKPKRGPRRPPRAWPKVPRNPAKSAPYPNAVVSAGGYHSAVVTQDGRVWTFGDGSCGQLGHLPKYLDRNPENELLPRAVEALDEYKITAVSCGLAHTAFLTAQGDVFTCGFARSWLGHGDWHEEEYKLNVLIPQQVQSLRKIARVACGWSHTLAVQEGGMLFSWGDGADGRLGHGNERDCTFPSEVEIDEPVMAIAAGAAHSVAVLEDGSVMTWGTGRPLGHDSKMKQQNFPKLVQHLKSFHQAHITYVDCGAAHTVALDSEGKVYTWGWGQSGQLGHGNREDRPLPSEVSAVKGKKILRVSAGAYHTVICSEEGELITFGAGGCSADGTQHAQEGEEGRLGHGDLVDEPDNDDSEEEDGFTGTRDQLTPKSVTAGVWRLMQGYKPKHLAAGGYHTFFSTEGGRVYSCGAGSKGRLGLGNEQSVLAPAFMEALRGIDVPTMAVQDRNRAQWYLELAKQREEEAIQAAAEGGE